MNAAATLTVSVPLTAEQAFNLERLRQTRSEGEFRMAVLSALARHPIALQSAVPDREVVTL